MESGKQEQRVNLYVNIIFFVVLVAFVGLRICGHYGLFSFLGKNGSYYLGLFTQIGLIFLLPILLLKVLTKSRMKDVFRFCCYRKVTKKVLIASVCLGIVVFFLNVYVSNFFNSIISFFGYKHSASSGGPTTWLSFGLSVLCSAILPAICEETLTRGIVLNGNSMGGMKKSIVISGFLFGLLHLNIEQFFYATLIGLFLGFLCWGCGSIIPGMIVHFMNNFLSIFFSFAANRGWGIGKLFDWIARFVLENHILGFALLILFLILLGYLMITLTHFMLTETIKRDFANRQKEFAVFAARKNYFKSVESIKSGDYVPMSDAKLEEKDFGKYVEENLNDIIEGASLFEMPKVKMTKMSKVFLIGSIILSSAITILTFVWGVL